MDYSIRRINRRDKDELDTCLTTRHSVLVRFGFGPWVPDSQKMKTEPNHAMERSRIPVTDRANARSAPGIHLAHLGR
jgi:hypothetical protein